MNRPSDATLFLFGLVTALTLSGTTALAGALLMAFFLLHGQLGMFLLSTLVTGVFAGVSLSLTIWFRG